jgi:hypothetical protein
MLIGLGDGSNEPANFQNCLEEKHPQVIEGNPNADNE